VGFHLISIERNDIIFTVTIADIENLGFKKTQARRAFQLAKQYMIVEKKCDFYSEPKVQSVPAYAVENVLGITFKRN
jgi:hypothetical protein